jgi:hypothetical protein
MLAALARLPTGSTGCILDGTDPVPRQVGADVAPTLTNPSEVVEESQTLRRGTAAHRRNAAVAGLEPIPRDPEGENDEDHGIGRL